MKRPDMMTKAWLALAVAMLSLLGLEQVYDKSAFLSEHFKNSHFIKKTELTVEPLEERGDVVGTDYEKASLTPSPSHTTRAQVRQLFAELETGKRKRLRIAYFADSMTEGDVVTEQLRRDLQALYKGRGLGFQGIAPRDASFRVSLIHRPSKEWRRYGLYEWRKDHSIPLAVSGEAYQLAVSATAGSLRLEQIGVTAAPWYERATLYWGPGKLGLDLGESHFDLDGSSAFNSFLIPLSPTPKLKIKIAADSKTWIYGLSLDSERGVILDNFTFRGNGGEGLSNLSPAMLQAAQSSLHYDLVLLHFGINALHHGETEFHWYRSGLRKTLEYLKTNLPGAKIVVLSVMDHAVRSAGAIVSDSSLPFVLAAQEAAAKDSGLWFVNLYSMMGGAGVMRAWVEAPEPLANKDYTHPNRRGGARLAKYIRCALLGEPLPRFDKKTEAVDVP